MNLKTRYVIKEQTISFVVNIFTTANDQKIVKVEDKWDGRLSGSSIAT